ncbi:MAG: hypothetical protein AB1489_41310 [Acidobacteriota bacterium]
MSELILNNSSKTVSIIANEEEKPITPSWFAELTLITHIWVQSALLKELNKDVKVARGRMGRYEVIDFTLILLAYGVSHEKTLKILYKITGPFQLAMTALWDRDKMPTASALSRFLASLTAKPVEALRKLLFEYLLKHGISIEAMGGLYDYSGNRNIIFDIDATREVARQRQIPSSEDYPPPRRRRLSCKAGYAGRKRGEAVRSRTSVQQAHTHEWLATFGGAGNGDIWGELNRACETIVAYLSYHKISTDFGMVRLDAAYGWAKGAYICQQCHLGYLMRSCDYGLLAYPEVQQRLAAAKAAILLHPDSNKRCEVYDLGFLTWHAGRALSISVNTRLIVICSDATNTKGKIGKRYGNTIYELFVTSYRIDQLSAVDIVNLYCGRGGFEQTLNEEDVEQDPDRWCSGNGYGQEFWQLLSQWLWNTRLRLGYEAIEPQQRRTLWNNLSNIKEIIIEDKIIDPILSDAKPDGEKKIENPLIESLDNLANANVKELYNINPPRFGSRSYTAAKTISTKIAQSIKAKAKGRSKGKFAGDDFKLQEDGTIRCPANKILTIASKRKTPRYERIIYEASIADCKKCNLAADCMEKGKTVKRGRSFSICLPIISAEVAERAKITDLATIELTHEQNRLKSNGMDLLDDLNNYNIVENQLI